MKKSAKGKQELTTQEHDVHPEMLADVFTLQAIEKLCRLKLTLYYPLKKEHSQMIIHLSS